MIRAKRETLGWEIGLADIGNDRKRIGVLPKHDRPRIAILLLFGRLYVGVVVRSFPKSGRYAGQDRSGFPATPNRR